MHQEVFAEACALRLQLIDSSGRAFVDLPDQFPIDHYLAMLAPGTGVGAYGAVPEQAAVQCANVVAFAGADSLDRYHRVAMLDGIAGFPESSRTLSRPPSILRQAASEFRRMVRRVKTARPGLFVHGNDQFDKDFAICRGKLLSCGAQRVDVRSGVPRSVVAGGGPVEATRVLRFFGLHARGYRPFLAMHLDPRAPGEFSPARWDRCYPRIAEILQANPELKGVFGSSWWFDPAVGRSCARVFLFTGPPVRAWRRGLPHRTGSCAGQQRDPILQGAEGTVRSRGIHADCLPDDVAVAGRHQLCRPAARLGLGVPGPW